MVDALKQPKLYTSMPLLHQSLHGYSDGHQLIESSFKPQDDLTRLMLRISDLSGSSIVRGFEEYITGYPLASINAYALAKTWYAPEMPRPGCVWTHTIVIPEQALAEISNLNDLQKLFRRPADNLKGCYNNTIQLESLGASQIDPSDQLASSSWTARLLYGLYENPQANILVPTANAKEYETAIFAVWSQQWCGLRKSFTFCTGSLSARNYAGRPFTVQCVPKSLVREVFSEIDSPAASQTIVLDSTALEMPVWTAIATQDASQFSDGELRRFLWSAADSTSGRKEYIPFVKIFDSTKHNISTTALVDLVADVFPEPAKGVRLKNILFGPPKSRVFLSEDSEEDILLALGKTEHSSAFTAESLSLDERGREFCKANLFSGRRLLGELFRLPNPCGEIILAGLISALDPKTAVHITAEQPQFLPALIRAKPSLACSPELWLAFGDRNWELFESLAAIQNLDAKLISGIVGAILDSESDALLNRVFKKWGEVAVFGALDWIEAHQGKMSEACRMALTFHDTAIVDWVEASPQRSLQGIVSASHIVAPYAYNLWKRDSTVWERAYRELQTQPNQSESIYICTFLLAMALGNAKPNPLTLISETFEAIHDLAARDKLGDKPWMIMDPIIPHLSWFFDWDKCERMRRGLVEAFIKYQWPATELTKCIRNPNLRDDILRSAYRVDGGWSYFHRG